LKCNAVVLYHDQSPQNCSSQEIKQIPRNKIMVILPVYFLWFNLWYNSIIVNFWHVKKAFHMCWDFSTLSVGWWLLCSRNKIDSNFTTTFSKWYDHICLKKNTLAIILFTFQNKILSVYSTFSCSFLVNSQQFVNEIIFNVF